KLTPLCVTL
nr:Chain C, ENVELOPE GLYCOPROTEIN GP160 [Human immunodeficiency virus 1]2X4O_F Chain F, ENVELOPE GLYCOPROTEIN GP160 [Human immunodeficiency virus 1]